MQVYKLPAERLYATYFGGDASQGLPADDEAKGIWLRFLPEERVLPFGCKVHYILLHVHYGTVQYCAVRCIQHTVQASVFCTVQALGKD